MNKRLRRAEMRNILMVTDLEGMPNITSLSDSDAYEIYFNEIDKLSKQMINIGFWPYICDVHNSGKCLEGKKIENITIYRGISRIDFSVPYDFAILAGFHGMAGHEGVWAHTFTGEIERAFLAGLEAGEITFFCNWLFLKGVEVKAVLGVHGIEEEAISMNIPYYLVSNQTTQDDMSSFLSKAISSETCFNSKTESIVKMKLRNKEICDFLRDKSLHIIENDMVCFNNLNELIYSIEDLCILINTIKREIISRNIDFVKTLKKKYTIETYACLRELPLLNKGLDELTKEDLLQIQRMVENEDYKKFN